MVLKNTVLIFIFLLFYVERVTRLSGSRGELGDSLGALRDSVLGELTREEKSDCSLDLSGGKGGLLGVAGKAGGFQSDSLEDVVDERVQD